MKNYIKRTGFSIAEIVVSIAMIGMIIFMFSTILYIQELNRKGRSLLQAHNLIVEELESLSDVSYEALAATNCPASNPCAFKYVSSNFNPRSWNIVNQELVFSTSATTPLDNNLNGLFFLAGNGYTNFSLTASTTIASAATSTSGVGFVWHYQDQKNYYRVYYTNLLGSTSDPIIVEKIVDGALVGLASVPMSVSSPTSTKSLRLDVNNTSIKVFVDNILKVDINDPRFISGPIGLLGLNTQAINTSTNVRFDNIQISNIAMCCPVTYATNQSWNFNSSPVAMPTELQRFGLYGLTDAKSELVIEDAGLSPLNVKKITARIRLNTGQKVELYTLISKYGLNFR